MKHFRIVFAFVLALSLLAATACSGGQPSASPAPESSSAAPEISSSEPAAPSSADPAPSSGEDPASEPAEESKPSEEPEAVETAGGTVADLTAIVTGEITQEIAGLSGQRAGTAAERDSLMKLLSSLKPGNVSLIVIGDPLSGYPDQTLLSDEDAAALVTMVSGLPAPGVFEALGNPSTGGILFSLYIESGDQAVRLSDDGFWLTASVKGQTQALVFDSTPCKAVSEALSGFLGEQLAAAQGNILTLS